MDSANPLDAGEVAGRLTYLLAEGDESAIATALRDLERLVGQGPMEPDVAGRLGALCQSLSRRVLAEREVVQHELERIRSLRSRVRRLAAHPEPVAPVHLDRSV